jgi:hypothetical protein
MINLGVYKKEDNFSVCFPYKQVFWQETKLEFLHIISSVRNFLELT